MSLSDVPLCLLEHIARSAGYDSIPAELFRYDASSVRRRHMLLIRDYAAVKAWGEDAEAAMEKASRDAAHTLEDIPDIINVVLEQLVRQRFELPAFSTLLRAAQHARALANREYQSLVCDRLDAAARERLAIMLTRVDDETKSPWHRLKGEPKQPTAQNNRDFLDHLAWLKEQAIIPAIFRGIPDVKLKQFAAEARSLDAASMNDLTETKRLTLAATLVFTQTGRALDDVADMYLRLVQRLHNQARTALLEYQAEHVERTDNLVAILHGVTLAYRTEGSAEQRLSAIGEQIEPNGDRILEQCEAHQATAGRNYLPFLTRYYSHQRAALFSFLESVELLSTSSDRSMTGAIKFLIAHRKSRLDRLPIKDGGPEDSALDLSFVGEPWWPLVVPGTKLKEKPAHVSRRWFELCALTEVMRELKSGDLCIPGSDRYSDFREQFVSEEECLQGRVLCGTLWRSHGAEGFCRLLARQAGSGGTESGPRISGQRVSAFREGRGDPEASPAQPRSGRSPLLRAALERAHDPGWHSGRARGYGGMAELDEALRADLRPRQQTCQSDRAVSCDHLLLWIRLRSNTNLAFDPWSRPAARHRRQA